MGTLSQRGTLEPSRWVVVFWGMLTGGVAALLLWTVVPKRSTACRP